MKKRLLTLLLAATLITSGTAVTPLTASAKTTTDILETGDIHAEAKELKDGSSVKTWVGASNSTKGDSYWDQYSGHIFYDQLDSSEKRLYDKLKSVSDKYLTGTSNAQRKTLNDGSSGYYTDSVTYSSDMNFQDAFSVATIFCFENPQYYFLNDGIAYTEGYSNYFWDISEDGTVALGVYSRYANGTTRQGYTEQYRAAIEDYINGASAYSSDLAKETYFHDRLASEVSYNQNTNDYNEDSTESQSSSSAFLSKNTVCAGYTKALSLLLNSQGIDNVGLTSDSHAWNEVKINGNWYITDVTWDQNKWPSHEYFNISEYEMQYRDQQWAHSALYYYYSIRPACTTPHTSDVDAVDLTAAAQQTTPTDNTSTTPTDNTGTATTPTDNTTQPTITPVTPEPQQVETVKPVKPYIFTVTRTKRGTFRLTVKTREKVTGYYVYYRIKGEKVWDTKYVKVNGKSKTFTLSGLIKGRTYQLRAYSANSDGTLSNPTKIRTKKA